MKRSKLILFFCWCVFGSCQGTIWKTEDAYIIDDLPDNNDTEIVTPELENVCMDSNGVQGQCVSMEECTGYYKFFVDPETKSNLGTLNGMAQYLNGTNLEPCAPTNESAIIATTNFVCCTSLKYANVRSISLDEYKSKYPSEIQEGSFPKIKAAEAQDIDTLVVEGQEAQLGEFPYAVAIMYRGQQICGGSLIDSLWVLSAAHCFDRFNSQAVRQLVIKVGDHNIASQGETRHQDISVAKLFLHPGFFRDRGYFRDDVALIKLKVPVSPSTNIRTVSLHTGSPSINGVYTTATVCGWGKTCDGCPQSSVLRKTTLSIVDLSQCSQRYAGTAAPPITQNMICAGGQSSRDACNGDSGGPLVLRQGTVYQIGIVSWGIGCGKYPGVYTRVSSFVNWVTKHKK